MARRIKNRENDIFSLSFLDVICCGFGAVLLIFILTTGKRTEVSEQEITELRELVGRLERDAMETQTEIERLINSAALLEIDLEQTQTELAADQEQVTEREEQLAALLLETAQIQDVLAQLMADAEDLPSTPDPPPLPIPNIERRHYLSGLNLSGEYILFIIEASGGMLADTIEQAIELSTAAPEAKRDAPKWRRVVRAVEWMIANIPPGAKFQIITFNQEATPLLTERTDDWIDARDQTAVAGIVRRLREVVPVGGANFERAFTETRFGRVLPDAIVLFADGLPTLSDSLDGGDVVDDAMRVRYFRTALRQLPPRVPVNTVLFPMGGDPAATMLFWNLAFETNGSLVSPAREWPGT
jgi:hypothetical protein